MSMEAVTGCSMVTGKQPVGALTRVATPTAMIAALFFDVHGARATERGEVIQVDNVGVPLYVHNFDTGKDTSIGDKLSIAEFLGGHYFVTDRIRVGMMVQITEQFTGDLAPHADRWTTFALLPQLGWYFYDRFFVAGVFTYAPRSGGKDQLDLGLQVVAGGSLALTDDASFGYALEVPYNFHVARTIGITPLLGFSYKL
jgi:hypothetical protein